ncbi:MAG: hypothetical protein H0V80_18585, partial [Acidobacteria bacterium]|nr:hypothetical protein [Acidobacteriota bacterium]
MSEADSARSWRLVIVGAVVTLLSHAALWTRVLPLVPGSSTSRSPSSDVLMQALPMTDTATQLAAIARQLPRAPGVVVTWAAPDAVASVYFVVAMHLWPRPVSLLTCSAAPHYEQFGVPHTVPPLQWRIDLHPGKARPLRIGDTSSQDPR